jgi:cytosine/adenosine deaminase-related metal-dependent hydrolase
VTETRTLLKGGRVLSLDPSIGEMASGDVLIEGTRIAAVAPSIDAPDAEVVDATDCIVHPGYVDTHRHVWQTQLRSVATDWSLFDYFVRMRSIYSGFYGPEDVWLGNHVGALEALNAGITTMVDHCHILNSPDHSDAAVAGLKDSGIRGVFCYGFFDNPPQWPGARAMPDGWRDADVRRVRAEHFAADDDPLVFGFAPAEVTAMPFDLACAEIALARELSAHRISMHVSMGAYDAGGQFVRLLGEAGLLGEDMLFVHGASLTNEELRYMRESGAGLSVTPETELQMAMGHPVAIRSAAAGVRTALGIDIVSNYAGDMQAQMRLLLQAQRGLENATLTGPPRAIRLKAAAVLDFATRGGAEVLGWSSRIGTLTPGKDADVVLTRIDAINTAPCIDAVGTLVLNANPSNVDSVFVAGRAMKRDGALVGVDWPDLSRRLRASSERITEAFAGADLDGIETMAAGLMGAQ